MGVGASADPWALVVPKQKKFVTHRALSPRHRQIVAHNASVSQSGFSRLYGRRGEITWQLEVSKLHGSPPPQRRGDGGSVSADSKSSPWYMVGNEQSSVGVSILCRWQKMASAEIKAASSKYHLLKGVRRPTISVSRRAS
mmetsp:Transcript_44356/g.117663  ORF Transcript_44356/g.117663 Transcript_44356/m.117663 type:complete len:140 (+) Transcript_44356:331-750(+)